MRQRGTYRSRSRGDSPVTTLQVRLLDDRLCKRLQNAAAPGTLIRLGEHQYQIAQAARLVEQVSWDALRRWSGAHAWQVRFLTPACFRRGSRTSPWPAPESLARSLADRWQRLDPATAPEKPRPGQGPVWVSDIEGRSQAQILTRNVRRGGNWRFDDEVISGVVGRVRYVCDHGSGSEAADFAALLAFASFAGVGSHTTCGFGVVVPEPTWQPPTVRTGPP